MTTLLTRTFSADHTTPVRAYAALRAQSLGRSSYLLESNIHQGGAGRYSVLGYRTRAESLYPGLGDTFPELATELATIEAPEGVAERFSQAIVGYVAFDSAYRIFNIEPWPTEKDVARTMRDATVVVFDHHRHTITIAGRSKGALARCEWEMEHGPALAPLAMPDPDMLPEHVDTSMEDLKLTVQSQRAKKRIDAGDFESLVITRTFICPQRNADPFDVYRALRVLSPSAYTHFMDFAETPFAPGMVLAGASPSALIRTGDEGNGPAEAVPMDRVREAFPSEAHLGSPRDKAAKLMRDLEGGPRVLYGGAIGLFRPDGHVDLAVGHEVVVFRQAEFHVTAGATLTKDTDPADAAEMTRQAAKPVLSAIRSAHDAVIRRDEEKAAKAKREAEAEKAEAEKAEAEKANKAE